MSPEEIKALNDTFIRDLKNADPADIKAASQAATVHVRYLMSQFPDPRRAALLKRLFEKKDVTNPDRQVS